MSLREKGRALLPHVYLLLHKPMPIDRNVKTSMWLDEGEIKGKDNQLYSIDATLILLFTFFILKGKTLKMSSTAAETAQKIIKCRKCRIILTTAPTSDLLNAHNEQHSNESSTVCPSITNQTELYLNEEHLDTWIQEEIEKSDWTKGKLKCSKCGSNVGSFDFITGQKCECRSFAQPAVHFIKSKIDVHVVR